MNAILTAAEMRAAEAHAIATGTPVETLMNRAGLAAAEAIWRFAGPLPALVLCGPGNNGGDGYIVARELKSRGVDVRIASIGEPASEAARDARAGWNGLVERLDEAAGAPVLVDSLFGTGLKRPLDGALVEHLLRLAHRASVRVAIDLPSGIATDDGTILSPTFTADLTITFATLKPSHLLYPAADHMGRLVIADIGIAGRSELNLVTRPLLRAPGSRDHKYSRGYVAIVSGDMPGAANLAAVAAARAGAGYVRLLGANVAGQLPNAVVQSKMTFEDLLEDRRVGAVLIGSGLGRGPGGEALLIKALRSEKPLIIDGDGLVLLAKDGPEQSGELKHMPILTPHAGEFAGLFRGKAGSKIEMAREAARTWGSVVVFKGSDTVIASSDGRAAIARPGSHWLATAGTGDVLAGIIAALRSGGMAAFDAACAGVWLHGRAAQKAGVAMIADDLPQYLPSALAECV